MSKRNFYIISSIFLALLITSMAYLDRTKNMSAKDWSKVKYFEADEFSSPDFPLSYNMMSRGLVFKLDLAREMSGVGFTISSGYRTKSHNTKVGGISTSRHVTGDAVDILISNSSDRFKILKALIDVGFNKIGIYPDHLHVELHPDNDDSIIFYN